MTGVRLYRSLLVSEWLQIFLKINLTTVRKGEIWGKEKILRKEKIMGLSGWLIYAWFWLGLRFLYGT